MQLFAHVFVFRFSKIMPSYSLQCVKNDELVKGLREFSLKVAWWPEMVRYKNTLPFTAGDVL